jgi:hypothetical protein
MNTTKHVAAMGAAAALIAGLASPTVAGATGQPSPTGLVAAGKTSVDVDVKVINKVYVGYGESYTTVNVRAKHRKTGKPVANGRVVVTVTFYPKGLRMDAEGWWLQEATGAKSIPKTFTANLNGKGRATVQLGQNCRYCSIPPLKGARASSVGVAYAANGTKIGTDRDPRKKVTQRKVRA